MSTVVQTLKPPSIGFVLYEKGDAPGTLSARAYTNLHYGTARATGGPKKGFAGRYHVRYFHENGDFASEFELVIEKRGDVYDVSWLIDQRLVATGVGMEIDHSCGIDLKTHHVLAIGWRRTA